MHMMCQVLPGGIAAPLAGLLQLLAGWLPVHWTSLLLLLLLVVAAYQSGVLLVTLVWGCLTSPDGLHSHNSSRH